IPGRPGTPHRAGPLRSPLVRRRHRMRSTRPLFTSTAGRIACFRRSVPAVLVPVRQLRGSAGEVLEFVEDERQGLEWEELARRSVARMRIGGRRWLPASRWWGNGLDGRLLEL